MELDWIESCTVLWLGACVSSWSEAESDTMLLCDVAVGNEGVVVEAVVVDVWLVLGVASLLRDEVDVVADCCLRLVTRVVDITIKERMKKRIYILRK